MGGGLLGQAETAAHEDEGIARVRRGGGEEDGRTIADGTVELDEREVGADVEEVDRLQGNGATAAAELVGAEDERGGSGGVVGLIVEREDGVRADTAGIGGGDIFEAAGVELVGAGAGRAAGHGHAVTGSEGEIGGDEGEAAGAGAVLGEVALGGAKGTGRREGHARVLLVALEELVGPGVEIERDGLAVGGERVVASGEDRAGGGEEVDGWVRGLEEVATVVGADDDLLWWSRCGNRGGLRQKGQRREQKRNDHALPRAGVT